MKYSIIWGLVFLLSLVSVSAVLDDAIGGYTMDDADITGGDDYIDITGGGDTILAQGTPTTGSTGILDQAVTLDGSSDWYDCVGCHSIDDASDDFAISTWINPSIDVSAGQRQLVTKAVFSPTRVEYIMQVFNGDVLCQAGDGGGISHALPDTSAGVWSHVVCSYRDDNDTMTICINNDCVSGTDTNDITSTAGDFEIGSRGGGTSKWQGKIDMTLIYDRELSSSEVSTLYNGGSAYNPYASTPASPFFQVTAKDLDTVSSLQNISVILENGTIYTNASSTFVATNINDSGLYNFTVSVDNYFNVSFTNYNTTADLQANMTEFPTVSVHNLWDNVSLTEFNFTLVNYTCEQPTTNESGCIFTDNGGNYSVSGSSSKTYTIIYKKPDSAVGGIWDVKHGTGNRYNVTIPSSCWNYNNTYLFLRVGTTLIQQTGATWTSSSAVYCQSGTFTYTNIGTTETASGQYNSVTQTGSDLWFDDDYSTGALDTCSQSWASGDTDLCQTARFYEETMYWSLNKTYTSTTVEQYVPLNESVNIIFQTHNYFNSTVTHDFTNSNDLNQSLFQSEIQFNASLIIFNSSVSPANFTIDGITKGVDENFYLSAGTYNVTFSKFGYINKTEEITVSAFDNETITISNVGDTTLTIFARTLLSNTSISNFSIIVENDNYSYSESFETTSSSIPVGIASGLSYNVTINASGYQYKNDTIAVLGDTNYTFYLYTTNSILFIIYDEITQEIINWTEFTIEIIGSIQAVNITTSNGSQYVDLLTPDDYEVRYYATNNDDYKLRSKFVTITTGSFQELELFSLNESQSDITSATITFKVYDENLDTLEDAIVKVQRYYIDENGFVDVWNRKTNTAGESVGVFETIDAFYKYIVVYNDQVLYSSSDSGTQFTTDATIPIFVNTRTSFYTNANVISQLSTSLTHTNTTNTTGYFSLSYSSAQSVQICLEYTNVNASFTGETCQTGTSGNIQVAYSVNGSNVLLIANAKARVSSSDAYSDINSLQVVVNQNTVTSSALWKAFGVFIALVLIIFIIFIAEEISIPVAIISISLIVFILSIPPFLLLPLPVSVAGWLIAIGLLIVGKYTK